MALNVFELFGKIAVDSSDANKRIDETAKKAQQSQGKMTTAFGKIGNAVVNAYKTDAPKQFNETLNELSHSLEEHEEATEDAAHEADKFGRELDNVERKADKTGNALHNALKKIGAAVATAFATQKLYQFGKACTDVYASIAAEESAFAQIMGDYSETAQKKLEAVAAKTGIISTRMTGHMTSLTAKFKGLGYGVEDATTLAADGLLIAADASAFWDMSLDESTSHLNSFINGSYEGGEAIGLFANDTQMAAYAIEQGIVKDTKAWAALDEATKQATRLDYAKNMMAQAGATGQAAKESTAYANVMANLKENWRQFQGVVGKPILENIVLPAMRKLNALIPKLTQSVQNGMASAKDAYDIFIGTCKNFVNDVLAAVSSNPNGELVLNSRLSLLFDGGVKAIQGILTSAGTLVAGIVGAITGKQEDADRIGGVFKDLFGVAGEVVIGIKDDVLAIFDWFLRHGNIVAPIIGAVATAMGGFAISHPALAAIAALASFIGVMTVDWANFESNYPHLVQMFEDLTGLDFTNLATSLSTIQETLRGTVEWFSENKPVIDMMITTLGAVAFAAGHHAVGAAMVAYGVGGLWNDGRIQQYNKDLEETGVPDVIQTPFVSNPDNNFNFQAIWQGLTTLFGGGETEEPVTYNDIVPAGTSGSTGIPGLIAAVQAMITDNQNMPDKVAAAVAEGFSGATITANIATGDVTLDGVSVGKQAAPYVDLRLGWKNGLAMRGNA